LSGELIKKYANNTQELCAHKTGVYIDKELDKNILDPWVACRSCCYLHNKTVAEDPIHHFKGLFSRRIPLRPIRHLSRGICGMGDIRNDAFICGLDNEQRSRIRCGNARRRKLGIMTN